MSRKPTGAQALLFAVSMAALSRVTRRGGPITVATVAAEMRTMVRVEPARLVEEAADAAIYAVACSNAKAAGMSPEEISKAGDAACIAAGGRPGPGPLRPRTSEGAAAREAAEIERALGAGIAAAHYYESGRGLPYLMVCHLARAYVDAARALIDAAPASTRRRWKAGR